MIANPNKELKDNQDVQVAPMIKLSHIHKYYYSEEETLHVLDDINLQVDAGEFLAIMGPSGSGKSTLINLLGFIDKSLKERI